ncbi:cytochrome P450 [Xylaria sp. FL0043]|nr:cytochrome P450 [Xylaria sp. FL0043]
MSKYFTVPMESWLLLPPALWTLFSIIRLFYFLLTYYCTTNLKAVPGPVTQAPVEFTKYDWPILRSAVWFFRRRGDFLVEGIRASATGNFSFYVGQKHVVCISGFQGRKTFFESKDLNLAAGFVELLAGIPSSGNPTGEESWARRFKKQIINLSHQTFLLRGLRNWTADIQEMCEELGGRPPLINLDGWNVVDPFDRMYELIYKLTTRLVGSTEIAEDRELLRWSLSVFERLERSGSTARIVFPWLITFNYIASLALGARLYIALLRVIQKRNGRKHNEDAVGYLLKNGWDPEEIVKFQMAALWAGILSTAANASWLLVILASNPESKEVCVREIDTVIAKHRVSRSQSPLDVLKELSLETWESEFPQLDSCLREGIRLATPGTAFRKNISGKDIVIGNTGEVIPNGSFAAYIMDDVHLNPGIYPQPLRYDPSRFTELDDASKLRQPYNYLGWGAGRHLCVGTRVAKLKITMIMAHMLACFDFELSDKHGNPNHTNPTLPSRNWHKAGKPTVPIYLRYKPRRGS